jgi:hypothetical protein
MQSYVPLKEKDIRFLGIVVTLWNLQKRAEHISPRQALFSGVDGTVGQPLHLYSVLAGIKRIVTSVR